MANKGVQKEVQKKGNRRLKRSVRKTFGALFLASAIAVAAIPTDNAQVQAEVAAASKLTWDDQIGKNKSSTIPLIPEDCTTIYTDANGQYVFAWVWNDAQKIAVLLKYNGGTLAGNKLVVPDKVDAYTKFSENEGSGTGYVAVSQNQKPLYYQVLVKEEQEVSGGDNIPAEYEYRPCYASEREKWEYIGEGKERVERPLDQFYYKDDKGEYKPTSTEEYQWVRHITVAYIGNQYLVSNNGGSSSDGTQQEWKVAAADYNKIPDNGVFANQGNIHYLEVGSDLIGIGNYAFYNCTGLESITLGNGITEIGHHAFASCTHLTKVDFGEYNNLTYLSDGTFQDCTRLTKFALSPGIGKIYDHAFDGCISLQDMELEDVAEIGYYVFKGCEALPHLVLPRTLLGEVHLNNFTGCTGLDWIQVTSAATDIKTDTPEGAERGGYTAANFKADVGDEFYFIGPATSDVHNYTQENAIAFKYDNEDRFEIIIVEKGTSGQDVKLTYQVNSNDELLYFNMESPVEEVTIPNRIGPHGVSTISRGSFGGGAGSCFLKKITIPGTVTAINADAFKGCHNLEHVIFQNAATMKRIDAGAFATQDMEGAHSTGCTNQDYLTKNKNPKLTFTGAVGSNIVPFTYAMQEANRINAGDQNQSYITYYSGWPTNLEIQYVYDPLTHKGAATLMDYPTFEDLTSSTKYTQAKYPYMTKAYEDAVKSARASYNGGNPSPNMSENEWGIIRAALNVNVPSGVKMIKPGLFSGRTATLEEDGTYNITDVDEENADKSVETVTFADIAEFEPFTFTGCSHLTSITITGGEAVLDDYAFAYEYDTPTSNKVGKSLEGTGSGSALTTVYMSGGGSTVGNYAFNNNAKLTTVTLSNAVNSLGIRPFKDCPLLNNVNFSGGEYFYTDKAIIYENTTEKDGSKSKAIVQCLESRGTVNGGGSGGTVIADDVAGVTTIYPEAFMDCEGIGVVELKGSSIKEVPEYAFANTPNLNSVSLPTTCGRIKQYAFQNSNVRYMDIPRSVVVIDGPAFNTENNPRTDGKQLQLIEFYCEEGSTAYIYAETYDNIIITDKPDSTTCHVVFLYYPDPEDLLNGKIIEEQDVPIGGNATPPTPPEIKGYEFKGWVPDYHKIGRDVTIVANYSKIGDKFYTITFYDDDEETVIYTREYREGTEVIAPQSPTKEGKIFQGWVPSLPKSIQQDMKVYATWRAAQPGEDDGTKPSGSPNPNNPNNTNNPNDPNNTGSPSPGQSGTLYNLTVQNGSGSGSYAEGSQPVIIANDPASGQVFDYWSVSPADVKIASTALSATIVTMPAKDVTVTAHYKAGSSSSSGGGGSTGSGNNSQRPGGSVSELSNGTTVVIDKNGLSNTGVVSATVHGSSDNFMIKISESNAATEAALRALMAEYGSLDNIKYFPMDISLYDSTGTVKITDTTGITVDITLPLPDSLITYAGNNKAASIVNDRLERLGARFTTIQGVSCITFTAEHFSPYVIYVDTGDLSAGNVSDSTPKTGDFIHPKWFLSIGLACLSFIMFVQKDSIRKPKKAKVKVRVR